MNEFNEEEWLDKFYGDENDEITHVCSKDVGIKCVDCAKITFHWNDNGYFLMCDTCLAIEPTLEMNQVPTQSFEYGDEEDEDYDFGRNADW